MCLGLDGEDLAHVAHLLPPAVMETAWAELDASERRQLAAVSLAH